MSEEAEKQIIQEVLSGKVNAYQILVERYQNYAFSTAFQVLKNREEAEEAAQDAFLKAYKRLPSFAGQSRFSTWLYTIVFRTAIDKQRQRKRKHTPIDDPNQFLQIADNGYQHDKHTDGKDLKRHLEAAMQQLKPIDATLIHLYYLNEQSVKEIVEITGLSATNIKTRLHRTREALKVILKHHFKQEMLDLI